MYITSCKGRGRLHEPTTNNHADVIVCSHIAAAAVAVAAVAAAVAAAVTVVAVAVAVAAVAAVFFVGAYLWSSSGHFLITRSLRLPGGSP